MLDVGIAAQTPSGQRAMMELLNFNEESNLIYPLRYLLGAAYTTHPGDYLLQDLIVSYWAGGMDCFEANTTV